MTPTCFSSIIFLLMLKDILDPVQATCLQLSSIPFFPLPPCLCTCCFLGPGFPFALWCAPRPQLKYPSWKGPLLASYTELRALSHLMFPLITFTSFLLLTDWIVSVFFHLPVNPQNANTLSHSYFRPQWLAHNRNLVCAC